MNPKFTVSILAIFLLGACTPAAAPATPTALPDSPISTTPPAAASPTFTSAPTSAPTTTPTATRGPTVTLAPTGTAPPIPTATVGYIAPQLLFLYRSDDVRQIRQIGIDGSSERTLATIPSINVFTLDVSPDGRFALFDAICQTPLSIMEAVYLFNVSTFVISPLTSCGDLGDSTPAWSPDGSQFALTIALGPEVSSTPWEIFLMDADGSGEVQLTDNDRRDGSPAWSPDGDRIAFQSIVNQNWEIYTMDSDGGNQDRLTDNDDWDTSPAWSPDGSRIAFISNRDGNFEVYTMKANGTDPVRLTNTSGAESQPAWSPDGTKIAYVYQNLSGGSADVYVMNADGSLQVRVTEHDEGGSLSPDWLPMEPAAAGPTATAGPSPTPHCAAGWSRLSPGDIAIVAGDADDPPNRVRAEPNTTAEIIALISPGLEIEILEGPVCADGLVFWKVASTEIPGGEGWTAEGDGTDYWLDPKNP